MGSKVSGSSSHPFDRINFSKSQDIFGNGVSQADESQNFEFYSPACAEKPGPEIVNAQAAQFARGEDVGEPDSPQRPIDELSDDDEAEDPALTDRLKKLAIKTQESGNSRRSAVSFFSDPKN